MNNRTIKLTSDGSFTLFDEESGEHFHSVNGAITESRHVFINAGLKESLKSVTNITILEIGFGTGLNALLTWHESIGKAKIKYHAIDAQPIGVQLIGELRYGGLLSKLEAEEVFQNLHQAPWNDLMVIDTHFSLIKEQLDLLLFEPLNLEYDLVYFDAFSPAVQPDLWRIEVFSKIFRAMKPGGILVTYSAKGVVKQALRSVGFMVERLPGPMGKRHMIRVRKT